MKKLSIILFIGLFVFAFSFSGQVEAQTITVYNTMDETAAMNLFESFEEEHGVRVEYVQLSTGEVVSRLEAESSNPQADLWTGGVGLGHIEAAQNGLTAVYDSEVREQYIPEQFRDPEGRWAGLYLGALAFSSNPDLLDYYDLEKPQSWADLVKPEFEDKVQMAYPSTSGTAYNVLATMVQIMGEEEAFEYMHELDRSIISYTRSGFRPAQNVAMGETPVAIAYAHDLLQQQEEGYPIEITFPEEGTGYEVASISIVEGGPNPEIARKLYDHFLSREAAEEYANFFSIPTRNDMTAEDLREGAFAIEDLTVIDQDDIWAGQNRERLLDRWDEEIGG